MTGDVLPAEDREALIEVLTKHRADGWVCTCGWPLNDSVGSVVDHLADQIGPLMAAADAARAELVARVLALCDECESPPLHSMIPLGCVRASELRALVAPDHAEMDGGQG